tara:strand:- start:96 stop:320 length:225 start_codon:yes stop_codon:yes gene_type:complete
MKTNQKTISLIDSAIAPHRLELARCEAYTGGMVRTMAARAAKLREHIAFLESIRASVPSPVSPVCEDVDELDYL